MTSADAPGGGAAPCDPSRERPLVQVALDFVDLPRALEVAREAVAGGAGRVGDRALERVVEADSETLMIDFFRNVLLFFV